MTRTHLTIGFIGVTLWTACSDSVLIAPENDLQAASVSADPSRLFGGHCETAFTFLAPVPGDPPNLQRVHIDYFVSSNTLDALPAAPSRS